VAKVEQDRLGRPRTSMMDPALRVGRPAANAGREFPVEILEHSEVDRLIAACSRRGPSGLRNRAMIAVMFRGGLRVAELVALEPRDLDERLRSITVRRGKGHKRRMVSLDARAWAVLEAWLAARAKLPIARGRKLFCTIARDKLGPGRPLGTPYVRNMLKERAKKAGIDKRVHPHGLRHAFAFGLLVDGFDLKQVQMAMGHSSLQTTDRYVSHHMPVSVLRALSDRTDWQEAGAGDELRGTHHEVAALLAQLDGAALKRLLVLAAAA
jgi:site-specific recombinase XerD